MDDGRHIAGLRLQLAQGWKTYWRVPGDTGLPPRLSWQGHGITGTAAQWPVPEIMSDSTGTTYGYHNQVIIPVVFQLTGSGTPEVSGQIDIGICDTICIPASLTVTGTLPDTQTRDPKIIAGLIDQPKAAVDTGYPGARCALTADGGTIHVQASVRSPDQGAHEVLIIETRDTAYWVTQGKSARNGDTITSQAMIEPISTGKSLSIDRSQLRITHLGSNGAVQFDGCLGG